jgi:hypothetical protein
VSKFISSAYIFKAHQGIGPATIFIGLSVSKSKKAFKYNSSPKRNLGLFFIAVGIGSPAFLACFIIDCSTLPDLSE